MALLELLEEDARRTPEQMGVLLGLSAAEAKARIEGLEAAGVIRGYTVLVDKEKLEEETISALIEVKVEPQLGNGYDRVAERIYQYDEVESVYLMSGSYDLTVIISGRTLKEVALFVGQKLAPLEDVTGTATHFILKKYKEKHLIFKKPEVQEERFVLD